MSFLDMDYAPGLPIMATHTNYPGSWTWQAAADVNPTNPQASYLGPGWAGSTWGLYGLGEVSEDDRIRAEEAVEALEAMAENPSTDRATFSAIAQSVREQLGREGWAAWGGVLGIFGHPSSAELRERLNNAQNLFSSKVDQPGYLPAKGYRAAVDETGAPREDSAAWAGALSFPGSLTEQAKENAPGYVATALGIGAAVLLGTYLYSYASEKGAQRARR